MVLADISIVSFARIGELDLLRRLFPGQTLYLTPACLEETRRAVHVGCDFLAPVVQAAEKGSGFDILPLDKAELRLMPGLPSALGAGERESVAVCLCRPGARLLTNDRRARNFCREKGIHCLDLPAILRALWKRRVSSKHQVMAALEKMEAEEGLVLKGKERIFR